MGFGRSFLTRWPAGRTSNQTSTRGGPGTSTGTITQLHQFDYPNFTSSGNLPISGVCNREESVHNEEDSEDYEESATERNLFKIVTRI
jgi:hypothetical protein